MLKGEEARGGPVKIKGEEGQKNVYTLTDEEAEEQKESHF